MFDHEPFQFYNIAQAYLICHRAAENFFTIWQNVFRDTSWVGANYGRKLLHAKSDM